MSYNERIRPEFLNSLYEWVSEGNRRFTIDVSTFKVLGQEKQKQDVWCFDNDLMMGDFATCSDDIPTPESLKEEKRQQVMKDLAELDQ